MKRFSQFSWLVLAMNIVVVLWGAVVRATVSGAGCGQHWPVCNGELLPTLDSTRTLIEFSHRVSSGVALLFVVALAVWGYRLRHQSTHVWRAALWSLLFMLSEAAIGAVLVLAGLVELDQSFKRAVSMPLHLINTFLLLGALTFTAVCSQFDLKPNFAASRARSHIVVAAALLLLLGITGALAALGDTLFPAQSLREGLSADAAATSPALLKVRMFHPVIAILATAVLSARMRSFSKLIAPEREGLVLPVRVFMAALHVQILMGVVNLLLLVPLWTQLAHLLIADVIIVSFAWASAAALSRAGSSQAPPLTAQAQAEAGSAG